MWKHPKYYKELRKAGNELAQRSAVKEDLACSGSSPARNKSDQAISLRKSETSAGERAPGQGLSGKQQAASDSQVVNQVKLSSQSQAASDERQATSEGKRQATSSKRQASE